MKRLGAKSWLDYRVPSRSYNQAKPWDCTPWVGESVFGENPEPADSYRKDLKRIVGKIRLDGGSENV